MAPGPFECPVCEQNYNKENRRPLVLPCNHSFCQRCLQGVKASVNPVCPMCRHDLSRCSIQDFVFCHQLVPDEDALKKKKKIEKIKNKTENTEEKVRNVCKQHEDLDYLFWCQICNCPACKMCLRMMHKNCDWVLLEERVSNLDQEFGECFKVNEKLVLEMNRAGFANRDQLKTVKRAIGSLKGLEEQLEMYYGLLASVHGDAEDCLNELVKCQKEAVLGVVNPLALLQRKVVITAKLQDLLRMPDQPDMPLLHLLENYEASVNMSLQPDSKRSKPVFPATLAGFGYRFKDGKLQNVDTGEGFNFAVKENNHAYNQAHYEALGEVMNEHVYGLLTHEGGLKRVPVPIEGNGDKPSSFIFASDDWKTCNRLMILIHGSGVVRAGQWARRLIINDNLNSGTQLPYIHRARCEGYGILVLNANNNRAVDESGRTWPIKGSEDPTRHADTVWRQYVMQSSASHIAIVAHSYGGCVATYLFTQFINDFNNRVFAVALTDSVHMITNPGKFHSFMMRSRNWVTSTLPLDTDMSHKRHSDVPTVSAGVTAHEMTSWGCFNSVFEFFNNRYYDKTNKHLQMASEEDYLFYPPSPPVRPKLQEERVESQPMSGQAVAHQVAELTSGASCQGAVGGGDTDDDDQEQPSEDEGHPRRHGDIRGEREDQESASDSGGHHRNDRLEQDGHKHRHRLRDEVHKKREDQKNDSDRKRHHHHNKRGKNNERDNDQDRTERRLRRKESSGENEGTEIISDSERKHHSNDERKDEKLDDKEKNKHRRHRDKRSGEKEGHESIRDSDRRHGHGASSDSGHSSGRRHKKNKDDDRRRSSRNCRNDDEYGNGAESGNGENVHKRKGREGKKDATTGKESSDDESQQKNEQTGKGGKVEDSQGGCRHREHRGERRSRRTADKEHQHDQKRDESREEDGGSNAEASGDEEGAGGENDSNVDQGRSGDKDESGEDKSAADDMSGDDGKSEDEGASGEEYFTPEQDAKDAKSAQVELAIQSESADEHGQTAAKD